METLIVYLDDAEHALRLLAPMKGQRKPQANDAHWILVACAPRMTRHISKWISQGARQSWRERWSAVLFDMLLPTLSEGGDRVTTLLAQGPLTAMTERLLREQPQARVLDARRPRLGQELPPVTSEQQRNTQARWVLPSATAAMGAALVLAAE